MTMPLTKEQLMPVILGSGEHRIGLIDAEDMALGADPVLDEREVQARTAGDVDHALTRAKLECLNRPEALRPFRVAGHGRETRRDVVVLRLLAIGVDQVLSRRVDSAHERLLELGGVAYNPRTTLTWSPTHRSHDNPRSPDEGVDDSGGG